MGLVGFLRNPGLGVKLNAVLILAFSLLLAVIVAVASTSAQSLTLQSGQHGIGQEARVVQERFGEAERALLADAKVLASRPGLVEALVGGDTDAARVALLVGGAPLDIDGVDVVDAEGGHFAAVVEEGKQRGVGQEDALLQLALMGVETTGVIVEEEGEPAFKLAAVVPLRDRLGQLVGGLLASRTVDDQFLKEINLSRTDRIHLALIHDGQVLALDFPGPEELEDFSVRLLEETPIEQALGGQTVIAEDLVLSREGVSYALAHVPLTVGGDTRAAIGILVNYHELSVFQRDLTRDMVSTFSVAALVVLGVVALFSWRSISVPISRLRSVTQHMAAGDHLQRAETATVDEIGQLGQAFNEMADELQQTLLDLRQRTRELEASQHITFAASERTAPDELLNLVVNLIREKFDLYHAQVYIVDEQQQAAVLRKSTGYAGRQLLQMEHRIPLHRPALVTKAIREGEPVLVADVSQSPDFMPNELLPETQSELVVPLKARGKVIGVLDVQDRVPDRFTESTVALFQTMADQITLLFENSELLSRVTEQAEGLTTFTNQLRTAADVALRMSTILKPDLLLQQVVELMQTRFGLYHAHIYLLDEMSRHLVVRAGSGEVGRVLRERGHSIPLDAEKGLVARAARERKTVLVNDTSLESDFLPNPLLPQTRSEVAVPLVIGERVLGVLDVQDDRVDRFAQTDVDTFNVLAGQTATALQNAGLFGQIERNLAETQVRFEISQALAGAQTEQEVLDALIQVADHYPEAAVSIFLTDPDADELTFVQSRAVAPPEGDGAMTPIPLGMRFPASRFPFAQHVSPDTSFVTANLALDERADAVAREFTHRYGAVSLAHLPIKSGSDWLGLITALSHEESYFDERKLVLYRSLAEQGATALRIARLYDEIQRTAQRLREVDRLKSEFLANMSHELRTPLNSIIGYAEIMLMGIDTELDPETREDVQAIYDNSQHLLSLINDVLDLAKIEAGRLALNLEEVQVQSLIDEVSSSAAGLLVSKPVELMVEVEEDIPSIRGDRVRLQQIFNNIVSNAAKFTEEGHIALRAFADDGWVCLEVKDTGIGISKEDLDNIFERFQQVDGSIARRAGGTGLGLAITRHLVEMHSGRIEAQSQPSRGSTFTVRLPPSPQGSADVADTAVSAEHIEEYPGREREPEQEPEQRLVDLLEQRLEMGSWGIDPR